MAEIQKLSYKEKTAEENLKVGFARFDCVESDELSGRHRNPGVSGHCAYGAVAMGCSTCHHGNCTGRCQKNDDKKHDKNKKKKHKDKKKKK